MARPIKEGLDYFPLDVDIDQDDKIALVEASHGLVGFAVIIKIFMKIYDNSYFYKWGEKEQLLFSRRVNVNINDVNAIINDCLKWGIFSEEVYKAHKVLTSSGIQKRYLEATSRRKRVNIQAKYLLLNEKEVNSYKNLVIVDINSNSDKKMFEESTQSKVKESKVKESKVKESSSTSATTSDAIVFYQENIGMITPSISDEMLAWIDDFGDEMVIEALRRAINRNKASWGYALSILRSWNRKNIKTIEQAKAEEVEFQNQQQSSFKNSYHRPEKKEVVPDWFHERNKQHETTVEDETKIVELKEILDKYMNKEDSHA